MRQTAISLVAIIPAISAKMFLQISHPSAFVIHRVRRAYRPAVPAFPADSFITHRNSFRRINLFSTSAEINIETTLTAHTHTEQNPPSALHTVVVHRNKQSMSFRKGTQLVFTKSIAATFSEVLDDSVGEFDGEPDVYHSIACSI